MPSTSADDASAATRFSPPSSPRPPHPTELPYSPSAAALSMTLSPSSPSLVDAESVVDISPSLDKEEAPVVAPADEPRADNNAAYSSSAVKEGSVDGAPLMRILGVNYEPPGGRVSTALSNTGSIGKEENLEWREKTEERSPTSPQRTDIHPLRLDIQPPTPPPWETAEPPDDNHMEFKREASFMNNKQCVYTPFASISDVSRGLLRLVRRL